MSFFTELKRRNVVRVAVAYLVIGWLLTQVSTTLEEALSLPPWFDSVIVSLLLIGFPLVLFFSWAYEITPDGIKKEKDVVRDESIANITAKKLEMLTICLLLVAIALFSFDKIFPNDVAPASVENTAATRQSQTENESQAGLHNAQNSTQSKALTKIVDTDMVLGVAVLPFDNLSEDPNNAFFAGGVHEDVLTQLTLIKKLRVISRTTMLKMAERNMEVRDIGQHLGVSHVLEGSVRRAADQVRVTVQLIDAATDEHIWADNFDRKLDDIFAIQSEIAEKIALQLKAELTPQELQQIEQRPTVSSEAYDLYLKARELSRVWRGADTFKDMLPLLQQAIELDPNFLKVQVLLVEVYGRLVWTGSDPTGEYRLKAKEVLDDIQVKHAGTHAADEALAQYLYTVERDYAGTVKALEKVFEDKPNNSEILLRLASSYKRLNNFSKGLPLIQKAASIDPEHESIASEVVLHLTGAGLISQAKTTSELNAAKFPDNMLSRFQRQEIEALYYGNLVPLLAGKRSMSAQEFYDRVSLPLYQLSLTSENLDEAIQTIDSLTKDGDLFSVGRFKADPTAPSILLNAFGQEQQSQQRARRFLTSFEENRDSMELVFANQKRSLYALLTHVACLANDRTAFQRFETLMQAHPAKEIVEGEVSYALAIAECGDIERAWALLSAHANTDGLKSVTPWLLALSPIYQNYFSELPEYQKMVADLQASKESR